MAGERRRGRGRPAVLGDAVDRIQIRVPSEVKATLAALSQVSGVSEAALVRSFVLSGVESWAESVRDAQPSTTTPRPRPHSAP